MKKTINFIFDKNFNENYSKIFSNIIIGFALLNIISVIPDIYILYSKNGIATDYLNSFLINDKKLSINDITTYLIRYNFNYSFAFISIFIIYFVSLTMILFDYFRFFFSIIVVIFHGIIINTSPLTTYGVDFMITFLLYINIFWCIRKYIHTDYFKLIFSFTIRLMQIQLCIIYFFGGVGKMLGFDWFDGNAIWLSMNLYMNDNLLNFIAPIVPKIVFQILSLHILFTELLFPFLVYKTKTRKWIVLNIILLHIGISLIIGLHTFSICMIIFNLIAFYPNEIGHNFSMLLKKTNKLLTQKF